MDGFLLKFLKHEMWLGYLDTYIHIKNITIKARSVFLQVISMLLTTKSQQQGDLIASQ